MEAMSFWWGTDLGDFIFKGLEIKSGLGLAAVCCVFALASILFEGLKVIEVKAHHRQIQSARRQSAHSDDRNSLLENSSNTITGQRSQDPVLCSNSSYLTSCKIKLLRTIIHTTKICINYFIMLAVMVFNGYLFISIVIGMILGNFIFGWIRNIYSMQTIYTKRKVASIPEGGIIGNETPSLLQEEGTSEHVERTCQAQINSSHYENDSSSPANPINDEPIVFSHEMKFSRKTRDITKIKSSKNDQTNINPEQINIKEESKAEDAEIKNGSG